jgi:uncharacterized cupredoxin-like copper-binding protein
VSRRRAFLAAVVLGTIVAAMAALLTGGPATATTGPDPYVVVNVTITDASLKLSATKVDNVAFVAFRIKNKGKLTHDFEVGTIKSRVIKPGKTLHFVVSFGQEGKYPYRVNVHGKRSMRGYLLVLQPIP